MSVKRLQVLLIMKNKFKYLLLDGLFEGGRMFVGAISVVFLISRGIGIESVGAIKIVQAITLIIFEVPTGVLSDILGRRISLTLSVICGVLGFSLYYLGESLLVFCIAEIVVALSLCFWSGAYESLCIENLKLDKDNLKMNEFFHSNSFVNKLMTLTCGLAGGYIALKGYRFSYLAAIATYIFLAFIIVTQINEENKKENNPEGLFYLLKKYFVENIRITFKEGLLNQRLIKYFLFAIALKIVIQPLLHYWQPYILSLNPELSSKSLGNYFFMYVSCSMLISAIYSKLSQYSFYNNPMFIFAPFVFFGCCFLGMSLSLNLPLSIILFCLTQAFLVVIYSIFNSKLNSKINSEYRAGILSSLSLFSRFGAILSLTTISLFYSQKTPEANLELHNIFKYSAVAYFIICIGFITISIVNRKRRQYAVSV